MEIGKEFLEFAESGKELTKKTERLKMALMKELLDAICTLKKKGYKTAEIVKKVNAFLKSEKSAELRERYALGEIKRSLVTRKMILDVLRECKKRQMIVGAQKELRGE